MLNMVASYHCIQFQRKPMIQTQENGKKLHFGTDLGPLDPISFIKLVVRHCSKLSSYAIETKSSEPNLRK